MNISVCLFLLLLLAIIQDCHTTLLVKEYKRVEGSKLYACDQCQLVYYMGVMEDNTTATPSFGPVLLQDTSLTLIGTSQEFVSTDRYTAVLKITIQYPVDYLQTFLGIQITSAGIGYNFSLSDPFTCYPLSTLTISNQTPLTRYSPQMASMYFTLTEDLSLLSFTNGNSVFFLCDIPNNFFYYCSIQSYYRGHYGYLLNIFTKTTSLIPTQILQDLLTVNITFAVCSPSPYLTFQLPSLYPYVTTDTTIIYNATTYPSQYGTFSYKKNHEPLTLTEITTKYSNTPLVSDYSHYLLPVLGNYQENTYIDFYVGNGVTNYYLGNSNYTLVYDSNCNFLTDGTIPDMAIPALTGYEYNNQVYMDSTTTFAVFFDNNQFSCGQYATSLPTYPFGYTNISAVDEFTKSFQITFQIPYGLNYIDIGITTHSTGSFRLDAPSKYDIDYPILHSLKIDVTTTYMYFTMNISDNLSGLDFISIFAVGSQTDITVMDPINAAKCLVEGDLNKGIYVCKVPTSKQQFINGYTYPSITLQDVCGNKNDYYGGCYDINLQSSPPLSYKPIFYNEPWNFTLAKFIPNNVDTSNGPVNVTMLFNFTNYDPNYSPLIEFQYDLLKFPISFNATAVWDYTNMVYRADFQVPARMSNSSLFYIIDKYAGTNQLVNYFGSDAQLKVWSSYADMMPPYVSEFQTSPTGNNIILSLNSPLTISYRFRVVDQPNGLKEGYFSVQSTLDYAPHTYNFNSSYRVSGDQYDGWYNFDIPLIGLGLPCANQTFFISKMVLIDNSNALGVYPTDSFSLIDRYTQYYNPMTKILYNTPANISVTCQNPISDLRLPYITEFIVTPQTVDIGSLNRDVKFEVVVKDDESGISLRHYPKVYLSEYFGDIIELDAYDRVYRASDNSYQFSYQTVLPPMYGYGSILLSIYGIVDKQLNIAGYTSTQLNSKSLPFRIQTNATTNQPIITDCMKSVYRHGGQTTLYGYGFGTNGMNDLSVSVDYRDGAGFVAAPLIQSNYVFLYFQLGTISHPIVNVRVQRGSLVSNIYTIQISNDFAVINPNTISCPSQCNGHGNCTVNGCACNDPWSGPDCSSKSFIIPTPTTNTTDPVIIIDTGNGTSSTTGSSSSSSGGNNNNGGGFEFKTVIAIYSIRELSISGDTVIEYFPSNWTYTNQTSTADMSAFKYHYSTQLNNTSTLFNVTIQYFINQSVVEFAGQSISLPPYSTKMSLDLTSYTFQSTLNTLQIIFNVEFISKKGGECLDKQFGFGNGNDLNDLQWMKLNIDDKSLYGNFIRKAILDGRYTTISNSLLDSKFKTSVSNSFIGINIPHYFNSVYLDPDFSHLLVVDGSSTSSCNSPSSNDKKGISMGAIAGIIIGVAIAAAMVIAGVMYFNKKRLHKKEVAKMEKKLHRI